MKKTVSDMYIGNVEIKVPIILAPMAGVTDLPFRLLCREQGAGLLCMEMVSAKAIMYKNKNTEALLTIDEREHPISLQLFGSDPEIMANVAASIENRPFDILDINMGCPVPKVVNNHEGSALMKDPELAYRIVKAVSGAISKPVTVKIRKGFNADSVNAVEFARRMEDAGAAAIAVHGRTREESYRGKADRDIIRQVKEAVSIPVIGNGDIDSAESAMDMFESTGCDGIMIGRAACGNPWIFNDIKEYLRADPDETSNYNKSKPTLSEKCDMLITELNGRIAEVGEKTAVTEMRSVMPHYIKGFPGASHMKVALCRASTEAEVRQILDDCLEGREYGH